MSDAAIIPSTELCSACQRIDFADIIATRYRTPGYDWELYQPTPHYGTFAELKEAAQSCPFCRLIMEEFKGKNIPDDAQTDVVCHTQRHDKAWKRLKGEAIFGLDVGYLHIPSEAIAWIRFGAFVDEASPLAKSNVITGRPVRPASDIRRLSEWLRVCNTSHEKCMRGLPFESMYRKHIRLPIFPGRIIEVEQEGSSSVHLIHGIDMSGPYISLSYCWGTSPTLKTTKANLDSHMKSIEVAILPKTFQDSIFITRKLGIRYLWIDSLCITQDDLLDWEIESAKMAGIYTGSYLTIAASSSTEGNGGLFYPRPESNISLKYTQGNEIFKILIRKRTPDVFDTLTTTPLNSRAWVIQESLLSPRTIHYTSTQLFWTCQSATLAEDGFLFDHIDDRTGSEFNRSPNLRIHSALKDATPVEMHEKWLRILKKYGKCQLSFNNDKLPALSGVASLWAEASNGTYLAGHWKEFLHFSLAWSCTPQPSKSLERAPSWSWASVDGEANFFAGLSKEPFSATSTMEDISAVVEPAGSNKFGHVKPGGSLTFKAPLLRGKTRFIDKKEEWPGHVIYEPWEGPASVLYGEKGKYLGKIDYDFEKIPLETVHCVQVLEGSKDWRTNIWLVLEEVKGVLVVDGVWGHRQWHRTGRVFIRWEDMWKGEVPPKRKVTLL